MKVLKKLVCVVLALALAAPLFAEGTKAVKTGENRDENGKIVRGPYLANGFWDNWAVGVDGGVNIFMHGKSGYSGLAAPYVGAYVIKWIDPLFGVRAGYQGIQGRQNGANSLVGVVAAEGSNFEVSDKMLAKFGFWYLHGDFLWNFTNTVWGYKEARFWNVIPYVHVGALRIYNQDDATQGYKPSHTNPIHAWDNEIAFGAGLFNTFRLTPRLHLTLDVREIMFSGRYHDWTGGGIANDLSVSAGLMVNLGKVGWDRGVKQSDADESAAALAAATAALAAAEAANKALQDDKDRLAQENDDLAKANDKLARDYDQLLKEPEIITNTDTVYVKLALGVAPLTLFFDKNSATLTPTEIKHLDYYVETVISKDPDRVFYFTGSADKSTGNDALNKRIARQRIENTMKLLNEKYGISKDRLKVKETVISDAFTDPRLDRSVKIEH